MDTKYSCFFCRTQYQVLSAITIAKNKNMKNADIYVSNQFPDCKLLTERLKSIGLFHEVFFVDTEKIGIEVNPRTGINRFRAFIGYFKNLIFIKSTVNKYINTKKRYQLFFMASNSFEGRFALLYYMMKGDPVQLSYFEDGIGSYFDYAKQEKVLLYDKICRLVVLGRKAVNIRYFKLLYNPKLYDLAHDKNYVERKNIIQIEKISSLKNYEIIENIFGSARCVYKQRYYIFDTKKDEVFNKTGIMIYNQLLSLINEELGVENFIYKYHPREREIDTNLPHFEKTNIPFECYCYLNDFSNHVFISSFSSAVFTPKLMFDQEPVIIFLYKIMEANTFVCIDELDKVVLKFKKLYRDSDKIIIPADVEELKRGLYETKGQKYDT